MRNVYYLTAIVGLAFGVTSPTFAADAEGFPGAELSRDSIATKCLEDLQAFDEQLWQVGFGVLPPAEYSVSPPLGYSDFYGLDVVATPREKMQALRQAAYVYVYDGNEESCERELAAMRTIFERHQAAITSETDDSNLGNTWRRAHLAKAEPVAKMDHLVRANVLIGSEVWNRKGERLGEITDIVLNPKKQTILYVLVSRGGFLGFREQQVAARWGDLQATTDHELYVLDVPPKAMDDAPLVDRTNFAMTENRYWQESTDQYWNGVLQN